MSPTRIRNRAMLAALLPALLLSGCAAVGDEPAATEADTSAAEAVAAARCSGTGCNGQWPDSSGCWSGAQLLEQRNFPTTPGYWAGPQRPWALKLWWSPACQTNWAEAVATGVYDIHSQVLMHDDGRYKYVPLDATNTEWGFRHWTKMYYAPTARVSACALTDDGFVGPSQSGCTGMH